MAMQGKVARWFSEKGYGFITADKAVGDDVFVHHKDIVREGRGRVDLNVGDRVEFDLDQTDKGKAARQVRIIG